MERMRRLDHEKVKDLLTFSPTAFNCRTSVLSATDKELLPNRNVQLEEDLSSRPLDTISSAIRAFGRQKVDGAVRALVPRICITCVWNTGPVCLELDSALLDDVTQEVYREFSSAENHTTAPENGNCGCDVEQKDEHAVDQDKERAEAAVTTNVNTDVLFTFPSVETMTRGLRKMHIHKVLCLSIRVGECRYIFQK